MLGLWAALGLFSLLATACHPPRGQVTQQRYENLMDLARSDLRCEDVKHTPLSVDVHVVQGCGRQASYVLFCNIAACRWVQNPGELAVANMGCAPERISMKRINRATYDFEGCGERLRYRLQGWTWHLQHSGDDAGDRADAGEDEP